jgi:hypothetical protein
VVRPSDSRCCDGGSLLEMEDSLTKRTSFFAQSRYAEASASRQRSYDSIKQLPLCLLRFESGPFGPVHRLRSGRRRERFAARRTAGISLAGRSGSLSRPKQVPCRMDHGSENDEKKRGKRHETPLTRQRPLISTSPPLGFYPLGAAAEYPQSLQRSVQRRCPSGTLD